MIDNETTPDEFMQALRFNWEDNYFDAKAELARLSDLAAKYERLTQALAVLVERGDIGLRSPPDDVGAWGGMLTELKMRRGSTPDSIADAIIKAALP